MFTGWGPISAVCVELEVFTNIEPRYTIEGSLGRGFGLPQPKLDEFLWVGAYTCPPGWGPLPVGCVKLEVFTNIGPRYTIEGSLGRGPRLSPTQTSRILPGRGPIPIVV